MAYEHRDYQDRAIQEARRVMARGVKRFIFQAPTGAGKTILAAILIQLILEKGLKVLFAAHRRELVLQPYEKFTRDVGIPKAKIGIIKADMKNLRNPHASIQIVSIQSVYQRALPKADVIIIDECHLARSASYDWLIKQYPNAYVIGLSGTPTRLDGRSLGDVFEEIIVVAQPSELFPLGYIVKPQMYTVPESKLPDLSGVHHIGGDFQQKELGERVTKTVVMGSIVDHYGQRAKGLSAMACGVTIPHSKAIADLLNGAGIRARHIDGGSSEEDRRAALRDIETGAIDVLCQVGLWIEGLDIPRLKCLIQARPTESIVIHLQSAGRIMRPYEGITPILLDHAGNCVRLGVPTRDRTYSLVDVPRTRGERKNEGDKVCKACFSIVERDAVVCPACGAELSRGREVEHDNDVNLVEITEPTPDEVKRTTYDRFWKVAHRDGNDEAWVLRKFVDKFKESPPVDWVAPQRERVDYTLDEKRASVRGWFAAAQKNNLTSAWVAKRYRLKFDESIESFYVADSGAKAEKVAAANRLLEPQQPSEEEDVKKVPLTW